MTKQTLGLLGDCEDAIALLQRRSEHLPADIAREEQEATDSRARLEEERERLDALERTRRHKEGELQDCEARRHKFQGQTALVKTNAEYSALLSEIDGIGRRISALEDEILLAMEAIEDVQTRLRDLERDAAAIGARAERETGRLRAELEEVQKQLEVRRGEREELIERLGPEFRRVVERIEKLHAKVTARIVDQICAMCHRGVPPETVNRVTAGEVHGCSSCKRILVAPEP